MKVVDSKGGGRSGVRAIMPVAVTCEVGDFFDMRDRCSGFHAGSLVRSPLPHLEDIQVIQKKTQVSCEFALSHTYQATPISRSDPDNHNHQTNHNF